MIRTVVFDVCVCFERCGFQLSGRSRSDLLIPSKVTADESFGSSFRRLLFLARVGFSAQHPRVRVSLEKLTFHRRSSEDWRETILLVRVAPSPTTGTRVGARGARGRFEPGQHVAGGITAAHPHGGPIGARRARRARVLHRPAKARHEPPRAARGGQEARAGALPPQPAPAADAAARPRGVGAQEPRRTDRGQVRGHDGAAQAAPDGLHRRRGSAVRTPAADGLGGGAALRHPGRAGRPLQRQVLQPAEGHRGRRAQTRSTRDGPRAHRVARRAMPTIRRRDPRLARRRTQSKDDAEGHESLLRA